MNNDDDGARGSYSSGPDPAPDSDSLAELFEITRLARSLISRADGPDRALETLGLRTEERTRFSRLLDVLKDIRVPLPEVLDPGTAPQWQPSVLAPVFYGFADHDEDEGLLSPARVFYPSLDGSPQDAPMLTGVGRYPVVLFLHGQCTESGTGPEHYLRWDIVPAQLARSGFVVIVPRLTSQAPFGENADFTTAMRAVEWVRTTWDHRQELLPRPMTAVAGHSWGALLGGLVAKSLRAQQSLSAFASLSGGWLEWPSVPPRPLDLDVATLFMWGTGSSDLFANLGGASHSVLDAVVGARHEVVFQDGEHWDYFREGSTSCGGLFRGPCSLMRPLAADFLTTFLTHYMPPQKWSFLASTIPHTLVPPPLDLTQEQEFFAGGHLTGFQNITGSSTCRVTHSWRLPPFAQGSIVLGSAPA